jgi:copper(I)-binding protein
MMNFRPAILAAMLLAAPAAYAEVTITEPWVRATVPQQKVTGAFMNIRSTQEARLVDVGSPLAGRTEIHEMAMQGDTMKMRAISALPLPAGASVELKPGGYHVMLFDLVAQAKEGDTVRLSLVVEYGDGKRETVEVNALVRPLKMH